MVLYLEMDGMGKSRGEVLEVLQINLRESPTSTALIRIHSYSGALCLSLTPPLLLP